MATLTATAGKKTETAVTLPSRTILAISEYDLAAVLAAADVIQGMALPKGAVLKDAAMSMPDLDTGTDLTLTLRVNDGTTQKTATTANSVGQTGGVGRCDDNGFMGHKIPNHDYFLEVLVAAGPSTASTGKIVFWVEYTMDAPNGFTGP